MRICPVRALLATLAAMFSTGVPYLLRPVVESIPRYTSWTSAWVSIEAIPNLRVLLTSWLLLSRLTASTASWGAPSLSSKDLSPWTPSSSHSESLSLSLKMARDFWIVAQKQTAPLTSSKAKTMLLMLTSSTRYPENLVRRTCSWSPSKMESDEKALFPSLSWVSLETTVYMKTKARPTLGFGAHLAPTDRRWPVLKASESVGNLRAASSTGRTW
mmetsp:Transcript_8843/g.25240  ORF Transcript_8843/g.25240 Transcript_8843/m.25240 type:complete len:215 (+) Transcript_8843:565-1209(+)